MMGRLLVRMGLVNGLLALGVLVAYLDGWVAKIFQGDGAMVAATITATFLVGLVWAHRQAWNLDQDSDLDLYLRGAGKAVVLPSATSHQTALADLQGLRHVGTALVLLGLLGTALGARQAFLSIDPGAAADPAKAAETIGNALTGIGIGVSATITGTIGIIWNTINVALLERRLDLGR